MFVSDKDKGGKCAAVGRAAEESFAKIAQSKGCFVKSFLPHTKEQKGHSDVLLDFGGKDVRVDVKAMKNLSRGEEGVELPIWIEFKNVRGGDGWIYGNSDFLAFEMPDHFMVIEREKLLGWCEENVDFETVVSSSKKAYKKVYRRFRRKDLITYVFREDISHLIYRKWKKA
jgi:hypothetical protein